MRYIGQHIGTFYAQVNLYRIDNASTLKIRWVSFIAYKESFVVGGMLFSSGTS